MIGEAADALRRGDLVILPTDTVYGLAACAACEESVRALYRVKDRPSTQATAVVSPDLETLFELLPELDARSAAIVRALLPGPYTLVLSNPARRYPWLNGEDGGAIGVRVPLLPAPTAEIVRLAGPIAATSANRRGEAEPRRLGDVPAELRDAAAVMVDGGDLPGTPSTVLDFTGAEPQVLREGAASGVDAIERARVATA